MFSWLAPTGVQHGRLFLDLELRPPSDLEYLALDPGIALDSIKPGEILSMVTSQPCLSIFSQSAQFLMPHLCLHPSADPLSEGQCGRRP